MQICAKDERMQKDKNDFYYKLQNLIVISLNKAKQQTLCSKVDYLSDRQGQTTIQRNNKIKCSNSNRDAVLKTALESCFLEIASQDTCQYPVNSCYPFDYFLLNT